MEGDRARRSCGVELARGAGIRIRAAGLESIEPCPDAEREWMVHAQEEADKTLFQLANSWYMGVNIPGKPRVFMPYIGGVGKYRQICDEVVADGYRGFEFEPEQRAGAAAE